MKEEQALAEVASYLGGPGVQEERSLSASAFIWLIVWNIAAGYWDKVALPPNASRAMLLHFCETLGGDPLEAAYNSFQHLRQALMALRKNSFEEIQREAPFQPHAYRNLQRLLSAYVEHGELGMAEAWDRIFPGGRTPEPEGVPLIGVIGGDGGSVESALEVVGALDSHTRVAAEWWYLRYIFGNAWEAECHMTISADTGGHFSLHHIRLTNGLRKEIYFRLPW